MLTSGVPGIIWDKALQLTFGLFQGFFVERRIFQAFTKLLHIGGVLVAQLRLDGFNLFAQDKNPSGFSQSAV